MRFNRPHFSLLFHFPLCCFMFVALSTPPHAAQAAAVAKLTPQPPAFECIGSYGERIRSAEQYSHYVFLNQGCTLRVLDIADPAHLAEIAWLRFDAEISMKVKWPALYVALSKREDGLRVYDVSNIAHPRLCVTFPTPGRDMFLRLWGSYLVSEGLDNRAADYTVYDVKDPLKPNPCFNGHGNLGMPKQYCDFVTDGTRLFKVLQEKDYEDEEARVAIQDVTSSPTTLAWHTIPSEQQIKFLVLKGKLAVGDTATSIATPFAEISPDKEVWTYYSDGASSTVQKARPAKPDKITIKNTETHGLQILENSTGTSPTLLAIYGEHSDAEQFKISSKRGYLIDKDGGLQILDMTSPARPRYLARHTPVAEPVIRAIEDDLVFLSGKEPGFCILDCANPTSPTLRGQYAQCVGPMSIQGKRAYVAAGKEGLQILDISNPTAIRTLGHFPTAHPATDLATSGTLVYLLAKYLTIVDAANPEKPELLSTTPITMQDREGWQNKHAPILLKKLGPALYLIQIRAGKKTSSLCNVIDVSNPAQPRLLPQNISANPPDESDEGETNVSTTVSKPAIPSPYNGWYLCLPSSFHWARTFDSIDKTSLTIFDLADPLGPTEVYCYKGMQTDDRVALYKNTLYLADGDGGLVIMRPVKSIENK